VKDDEPNVPEGSVSRREGSSLIDAQLDEACMEHANLWSAILHRACLRRVRLSGGTFQGADLRDAALDAPC
jgi:uncharacterized protein YjbI with pentapeptide repeats